MANQPEYGNNIEGVPLPGDIPQLEGSAAPNEEQSFTLANPWGEHEPEFVDLVKAQESEMTAEGEPFVPSKEDGESQMEDEENDGYMGFTEMDNSSEEGLFAETEPLRVEGNIETQSDQELSYNEINPDNIQYGPD